MITFQSVGPLSAAPLVLVRNQPSHLADNEEASLPNILTDQGKSGVRPPLKWAGGKRWQLHHLRPLWANHQQRRLVEPFCGGLAVALGLMPARAVLNDLNPHVINFYRWVQRGLTVSIALANTSRRYYALRT